MDIKLQKSLDIFNSLGWEFVTAENVLDLSLGTKEQQKEALNGLKSGRWTKPVTEHGFTYHKNIFSPQFEAKLAFFAIRLGVTVKRAASVLPFYNVNKKILVKLLKERGEKFIADFIPLACDNNFSQDYQSIFGNSTYLINLITEYNIPIPQKLEYMQRWEWCAVCALDLYRYNHVQQDKEFLPSLETIKSRFAEHAATGVALKVSPRVDLSFALIIAEGVKREFMPRGEAIDLMFSGLDAAVRPGERNSYIKALEEIEITRDELIERVQMLIPILSMGENTAISFLSPILISHVDKNLLTEVMLASFSATTKKAKKLILKAALTRECPENSEELTPWFYILNEETDTSIVAMSKKLAEKWGIFTETFDEETPELVGLWQETPLLWQVPNLEINEVTAESLTDLAAEIVSRPATVHDIKTEEFVAKINALAIKNPEETRTALAGIRTNDAWTNPLHYLISCWVNKEKIYGTGKDVPGNFSSPLSARDFIVSCHFGELPCILSTPSKVDLTITVPDLVKRLEMYRVENKEVLEADLFVALTRLDTKTATNECLKSLENLKVLIKLQSGKRIKITKMLIRQPLYAGQAVLNYLKNPMEEPLLIVDDRYKTWTATVFDTSKSLFGFPNRMGAQYVYEKYSIFPTFGDCVLLNIGANKGGVNHEQGLFMRQAARRSEPLPPGATINYLLALCAPSKHASEDSLIAIREAWERGLLHPKSADIKYFDWRSSLPSGIAAFASVLDSLARDGMLSIVWWVINDLINLSANSPKLLTGTPELVDLASEFLPEVKLAIEKGLTEENALDLPGIRKLAGKTGSSRAVLTAKKIVELLPEITEENGSSKFSNEMPIPFDEIWYQVKILDKLNIIRDNATVKAYWHMPNTAYKDFFFKLTLPEYPNKEFHVNMYSSLWNLQEKGYLSVDIKDPDTQYARYGATPFALYWDTKNKKIEYISINEMHRKKSPFKNQFPLPLTDSMLVMILLNYAKDIRYVSHRDYFYSLIKDGHMNEYIVLKATDILLNSPDVKIDMIISAIGKESTLLQILWPMLFKVIKVAGEIADENKKPPVWLNRVLDVIIHFLPYLKEAAKRGYIPKEKMAFEGIEKIAGLKSKSTAVTKAKDLLATLRKE